MVRQVCPPIIPRKFTPPSFKPLARPYPKHQELIDFPEWAVWPDSCYNSGVVLAILSREGVHAVCPRRRTPDEELLQLPVREGLPALRRRRGGQTGAWRPGVHRPPLRPRSQDRAPRLGGTGPLARRPPPTGAKKRG